MKKLMHRFYLWLTTRKYRIIRDPDKAENYICQTRANYWPFWVVFTYESHLDWAAQTIQHAVQKQKKLIAWRQLPKVVTINTHEK